MRHYQKARAKFKEKHGFVIPYATLFLTFFTVFVYFWLSKGQPYVYPIWKLWWYGVTNTHLWGAISYSFIHIGIRHLIGNVIVLFLLGTVLEQKIGGRHTLGIYASAGMLGGLFYALLFPKVWVIGASAAIAGLMVAAYLADFKKASVVIIIVVFLIPNVVIPATENILIGFTEEQVEKRILLIEQEEELQKELQQVVVRLKIEDLTLEEKQLLQGKQEKIASNIQIVKEEQEEVVEVEQTTIKGIETESVTPVSFEIHLLGVLFAMVYASLFKRSIFTNFKDDIYGIIKFRSKKGRRRTKKLRR